MAASEMILLLLSSTYATSPSIIEALRENKKKQQEQGNSSSSSSSLPVIRSIKCHFRREGDCYFDENLSLVLDALYENTTVTRLDLFLYDSSFHNFDNIRALERTLSCPYSRIQQLHLQIKNKGFESILQCLGNNNNNNDTIVLAHLKSLCIHIAPNVITNHIEQELYVRLLARSIQSHATTLCHFELDGLSHYDYTPDNNHHEETIQNYWSQSFRASQLLESVKLIVGGMGLYILSSLPHISNLKRLHLNLLPTTTTVQNQQQQQQIFQQFMHHDFCQLHRLESFSITMAASRHVPWLQPLRDGIVRHAKVCQHLTLDWYSNGAHGNLKPLFILLPAIQALKSFHLMGRPQHYYNHQQQSHHQGEDEEEEDAFSHLCLFLQDCSHLERLGIGLEGFSLGDEEYVYFMDLLSTFTRLRELQIKSPYLFCQEARIGAVLNLVKSCPLLERILQQQQQRRRRQKEQEQQLEEEKFDYLQDDNNGAGCSLFMASRLIHDIHLQCTRNRIRLVDLLMDHVPLALWPEIMAFKLNTTSDVPILYELIREKNGILIQTNKMLQE